MITVLFVVLSTGFSGDFRCRLAQSWPFPAGITEEEWVGSALSFYQRIRFTSGGWYSVFLTEKDSGEEWGDLLAGGLRYTSIGVVTVSAGDLRVQQAHGLVFSYPEAWGTGDPLALSKAPAWRLKTEPAENPSASDATPLEGVGGIYRTMGLAFSLTAASSRIDTGSSGLHRTQGEQEAERSLREDVAAFRVGFGPVGFAFALLKQSGDSLENRYTRIGSDFLFENESSVFTGEFAYSPDSAFNFLVSGSRSMAGIRQALTVSRCVSEQPRSSVSFGSRHDIGAGYGLRWPLGEGIMLDAGLLLLNRDDSNRFKAGFQLSERTSGNTQLGQRLKYTWEEESRTLRVQATALWRPFSDFSLSFKVPVTRYESDTDSTETGAGVEIRMKHSPTPSVDVAVSVAACDTEGWNSRVYIYSLSFPGEFGSRALYNSTTFLQGEVSLHVSGSAVVRFKTAFYDMRGEEFLGSGSERTSGSSRTSAGLQLDWKF